MVKKLSALFVGAMVLSFTPRSFSQVFSAEDFWAFGVEGSNLYGFTDPTTRITITTSLTAAPDFYGANHLATDADNNRVIYALSNYSSGYSVAGFYAWDLTTNTRIDITNGIDLGLIGVSWGGEASTMEIITFGTMSGTVRQCRQVW